MNNLFSLIGKIFAVLATSLVLAVVAIPAFSDSISYVDVLYHKLLTRVPPQ